MVRDISEQENRKTGKQEIDGRAGNRRKGKNQ
jgi:hypothetical protein